MAGLGVNGTAGVKGTAVTADWPQILSGYGGPVAIDPSNTGNWYVNDQPGVAIYLCSQTARLHAGRLRHNSGGQRCRCGRRWRRHAPARAISGRPARPDAVACGTCRVWRGPARRRGWTRPTPSAPFSTAARAPRPVQRRCADPLHGRHASGHRRRNHLSSACTARPPAARFCLATF